MSRAARSCIAACAIVWAVSPALAAAQGAPEDEPRLELHLRAQGWYQWVEAGSSDGDLHDFQLRRVYLSVAAKRWQVYGRYERLNVDDEPDTSFTSAGVSWLLDGHARKVTLDWTRIDHDGPRRVGSETEDRDLVTLQVAAGL